MKEHFENLKSIVLHIVVGVILFVVSMIVFDHYIGQDKSSPVAELSNASYPVMMIGDTEINYNLMNAYQSDVDLSLVRNQYTIVDNSKTIQLKLYNYEYDITAIHYVLFEKTPEDSLEDGTINKLEDDETNGVRIGSLVLQTDLKTGKDYYLQLSIRLDNNTKVYYYTKVQNRAGCHLQEYFDFVKTFHSNLFDKNKMGEISPYLETVNDTSKINYSHITIEDTSDEVTFGSMNVKEVSSPVYYVKELNDTYAVIRVDSVLSSEVSSGVIQYYDVSETYKLRYTSERMYLLDYDRTMGAYYNKAMIDSMNNYVGLGIQNEDNVEYMSTDSGYKVSFVEEGQLWYYNYQSSDVTQIYSYSSDSMGDLRNMNKEHGIHLLQMDDEGNLIYLLYGYMNRGKHEGSNGIQIMKYDAETNCNEELAFLKSSLPYDSMAQDLNQLSYLNKSNIFYCILDGELHKITLSEKKDEVLESGIMDDNVTASKNHNIIAVEKSQNLVDNVAITILDLDSDQTQEITCEETQRIHAVGFLSSDFIYGIASKADVKKSASGAVTFPMKTIKIVDMNGETKKTYTKEKRYIMSTEINGDVLEMTFAKKSGNKFVDTNDTDYIRYKEEDTSESAGLTKKYSETYGNQLYLKFPAYIYISIEPDLLSTKMKSSEDDLSITINKSANKQQIYYVYAAGQQQGSYSNLPEAVKAADEARGNVFSSGEQLVWECIYDSYAQVVGMDNVVKVKNDSKSLAGCLEMIAAVNGKSADAKSIDTSQGSVADLLSEYSGHDTLVLNGCSADEILYYVSKGSPVLAKYNNKRYVIVMSYNSTKIRYLDPVTGLSTPVSREQLTSQFEKYGNIFYSYLE